MKLLWICNSAPGVVSSHIQGKEVSAVNWVDYVLAGLRQKGLTVRILCPGNGAAGVLEDGCSYATFHEKIPYRYYPELEEAFRRELREFQPDVIHSWGTEYGHTLAMVNAAEKEGMLPHMAASIQGLCHVIAEHYCEGIPHGVQYSWSFRDLLRWDNIRLQQKKFVFRGQLERQALQKLSHIIGRTHWDRACTGRVNPDRIYHFCNETLREGFYEGAWNPETCTRHRIFAPACNYPVKGFHHLLEAFREVVQRYPDATITVTGRSFLGGSVKDRLRRGAYELWLEKMVKHYGLEDRIFFLGRLSQDRMKAAFLDANVFVLPSTIENSPNSLGEAMLLGVPCVASDVGGVKDLLRHGQEGYCYQSTAPYMLAYHVCQMFEDPERAYAMGREASAHASGTHNPGENLDRLLEIYEKIAK